MDVRLEIPDALGQRLAASGDDLSRRAVEAFALEEHKAGRIRKAELRRLLGIDTRYELDRISEDSWCVDGLHDRRPAPGCRYASTIGILTGVPPRHCDTSPINYLALIGHVDILGRCLRG